MCAETKSKLTMYLQSLVGLTIPVNMIYWSFCMRISLGKELLRDKGLLSMLLKVNMKLDESS